MNLDALQAEYANLQREAALLAGGLSDIPRRAMVLHHLYLDSGRNHIFSLIATHGALWAYRYFEVGGRLGRLIANRYFYNRSEKTFRLGILNDFAEGFRKVKRQVCIDTYTNYHFTKRFGHEPGADQIIPASLLDALNRVHTSSRSGQSLTLAEKRQVFEQSFRCEQEVTVAPGVKAAVDGFECPIMKWLCLRPVVRFAYFPTWKYFWFRDFSSQMERIEKGLLAYDLGESAGWSNAETSLSSYGLLERPFFDAPLDTFNQLRGQVLTASS